MKLTKLQLAGLMTLQTRVAQAQNDLQEAMVELGLGTGQYPILPDGTVEEEQKETGDATQGDKP